MTSLLKQCIRRPIGALGYAIRDVGTGVGGVELLHDARTLLGGGESPTLFDVGANVGQTTAAMLEAFRSPHIYAFEPSPQTFASLQRTVAGRARVRVEPLALGDTAGTLQFHVTKEHSVNDSLLAPLWTDGGSIVDVGVETIDGYCGRHRIDQIGLLKIDAQGYDLKVLKGAHQMLDARKIALYSCEANMTPMYDGQATLVDLLTFARDIGYDLVGFYEQTYVRNKLTYLDALFVRGKSSPASAGA
jgi:FkbM family methyltransferase